MTTQKLREWEEKVTKEFGRKSSDFYRFVRTDEFGLEVYEMHMVVNGNRYYSYHEETPSGHLGYIGEERPLIDKDRWDACAKHIKDKGFKYDGMYEMDIYGKKRKKEVAG